MSVIFESRSSLTTERERKVQKGSGQQSRASVSKMNAAARSADTAWSPASTCTFLESVSAGGAFQFVLLRLTHVVKESLEARKMGRGLPCPMFEFDLVGLAYREPLVPTEPLTSCLHHGRRCQGVLWKDTVQIAPAQRALNAPRAMWNSITRRKYQYLLLTKKQLWDKETIPSFLWA